MQDRYTGDLGDFGKYALLKALAGEDSQPPLKLGVHWYRVPDENHLNDGKFVQYLERSPQNDARFRSCDPTLHDALAKIVRTNRRRLEAVEQAGILPRGTRFFSNPLTYAGVPAAAHHRVAHRAQWHTSALVRLADCELVFCDPDNGLECGVSPTARQGPKFTRLAEVADFSDRGQSVVIYHHIGRRGTAEEQVGIQLARMARACPSAAPPFALRWHRGSSRAYLVLPSASLAALLAERSRRLLADAWKQHWSGPCFA